MSDITFIEETLRNDLENYFRDENSLPSFDDLRQDVVITSEDIKDKFRKLILFLIQVRYGKDLGFLLVFRDTCGWCNMFKPEFVRLYMMVRDWNKKNKFKIKVFAIDSIAEGEIAKKYPNREGFIKENKITGVPSFFIVKSGKLTSIQIPSEERDAGIIFDIIKANK